MNKLPKIFLAVSVITFAIGSVIWFSPVKVPPAWTIIMPVSAVTFGLFLIILMLQKEMAEFDRDEAEKLELASHHMVAPMPKQKTIIQPVVTRLKEKIV